MTKLWNIWNGKDEDMFFLHIRPFLFACVWSLMFCITSSSSPSVRFFFAEWLKVNSKWPFHHWVHINKWQQISFHEILEYTFRAIYIPKYCLFVRWQGLFSLKTCHHNSWIAVWKETSKHARPLDSRVVFTCFCFCFFVCLFVCLFVFFVFFVYFLLFVFLCFYV